MITWYITALLMACSFALGALLVISRYQRNYRRKAANAVALGQQFEELLKDHKIMQDQISSALALLASDIDISDEGGAELFERVEDAVKKVEKLCGCSLPLHVEGQGPCVLTFFN